MVWVSIGGPPSRTYEVLKQKIDERIAVYKKEHDNGKITGPEFHKKVNGEKSGQGYRIRTGYISNELARKIIRNSKPEKDPTENRNRKPDIINTDITKAYNQFGIRGHLAVQMGKEMKRYGVKVGIH